MALYHKEIAYLTAETLRNTGDGIKFIFTQICILTVSIVIV